MVSQESISSERQSLNDSIDLNRPISGFPRGLHYSRTSDFGQGWRDSVKSGANSPLTKTNISSGHSQSSTEINPTCLKLCAVNVQCIRNKLQELELLCTSENLDVLCVSEHWLAANETCYYSEIGDLKLGDCFCRVNQFGGAAVYVRSGLRFDSIDLKKFSEELDGEFAAVLLYDISLIVVTMYRSPNGNLVRFFSLLELCLAFLTSFGLAVAIGTDHNINLLNSSNEASEFMNILRSFNFYSSVFEPTRGLASLDSFLTNIDQWNYDVRVCPDQIADHKHVIFHFKYVVHKDVGGDLLTKIIKFRVFNDVSYQLFCESIEARMESCLTALPRLSADDAFKYFFSIFRQDFETFFPLKSRMVDSQQSKLNRPAKHTLRIKHWYTPELARLRELILYVNDLSRCRPDLVHRLRSLRKMYRSGLREAKQAAIVEMISKSPNPCRASWDLIKQFQPKLAAPAGDFATADDFNTYFLRSVEDIIMGVESRIGVNDRRNDSLDSVPTPSTAFEWSFVNTVNILNVVHSFKSSKSKDYFDMSTEFLKKIIHVIAPTLAYLVNVCLAENTFPSILKIARTVPVYKKGPRDQVSSFRPISLIPIFAKVFEAVMLEQLFDYFDFHCLLVPAQFGFRRGKSTVLAVDSLLQRILAAFESREVMTVTLCDLSKAFECISHDMLISKLAKYGLSDNALEMIRSYLGNRKQVVGWNGVNSSPLYIKRGVPQGSILGPFLFIVFMNDLYYELQGNVLLYADDTTLFANHRDPIIADAMIDQSFKIASNWFNCNRLALNEAKTQKIVFSLSRLGLMENDAPVKLLGFTLDKELCWSDHIEGLCPRLSRVLFLLRRLKLVMPDNFVRYAFFAFFQAHLVYGTRLWGHSSRVLKLLLLQKKAVRILCNASFSEHCRPLFRAQGILTVYSVYIFQCIIYVKDNINSFPITNDVHNYNTRSRSNIFVDRCRLGKVLNCFPHTGIRFFNHLPLNVRSLPRPKFVRILKSWLLENPMYSVSEFFENELVF
jgi:hypothetical protein